MQYIQLSRDEIVINSARERVLGMAIRINIPTKGFKEGTTHFEWVSRSEWEALSMQHTPQRVEDASEISEIYGAIVAYETKAESFGSKDLTIPVAPRHHKKRV